MTDAEFRELFALLERPVEPRPEFAERLFAHFDAVVTPTVVMPDHADNGVNLGTGPEGAGRHHGYLVEMEDRPMATATGRRSRRTRIIAALAVAALIAITLAVLTRSNTSPRRPNTPTGPAGSATTRASVTVTPNTGLADQQVVHVVGKGLVPGVTYTAAECWNAVQAIGASLACIASGAPGAGMATADATGTVSVYIPVRKIVVAPGVPFGVDCASPSECVIRVGNGNQEATRAISFGSTTTGVPTTLAPSRGQTVTVTPNTGLTDSQVVHVVGTGLVPGLTYAAAECQADPLFGGPGGVASGQWSGHGPQDGCILASSHFVIADATGTVSTYLTVQKVFRAPGGAGAPPTQVDCGVAPGCIVVVGRQEGNGDITIAFVRLGWGLAGAGTSLP
jgi:hypothetical protein